MNLHVPIVFIPGNVLGLDEWNLPICYQNPPFFWENASTKSGMYCFSVVPLIENSDGFLCFCGLSLLKAPWSTVLLLLPLFGGVPTDLA